MLILLASLSALTPSTASSAPASAPPLRIWMNGGRRFNEGERVRVQIDADVDGYLLVLNYDTDGRLRVLFPIDPRDDARVSAGRRYELRDDRGESAFRAGGDGTGFIYSAISRDPWRLDDLALGTGWDYSRLLIDRDADDPEAEITDLVQQLAGPAGFDYDVAGYRVYGPVTYSYSDYHVRGPVYVYDDYLYCRSWFWRYNGCHRYPFDGGWSIGFGYYPYDSWYYGYGYGYGYRPYGYGYYPYNPYYPYGPSVPGGRGPVVTGRPRTYTVHPRPATGERTVGGTLSGPRERTGTNSVVPPINWRPRSIARPAGGRGPEVTRNTGERTAFVPPARRARPEGRSYPEPRARAGGGGGGGGGGGNVRDYGDRGSGYTPRARSEPRSSAPPPSSRGAERQGGGNGGGNSGAVRGGGGGGGNSGAARGGGGGGGGNGGGGGHSSRPRRP